MKYAFIGIFIIISLLSCESYKRETFIRRTSNKLELINNYRIQKPLKRFQFYTGNFYAYDFSTKQILKLDNNFNDLDTLGDFGDAPHENLMVLNYQVLNDGDQVALFDSDKNTFKIQDFQDSVYSYYKMTNQFERGLMINDSTLFISVVEGSDFRLKFGYYNLINGRLEYVDSLNRLLDEPVSLFIYESQLAQSENKIYSFTMLYPEFFVIEKGNGKITKLNYGHKHKINKPEVFQVSGGYMAGDNPLVNVFSAVKEGKIYILSNLTSKEFDNNRIIDVYEEDNFSYLYSYKLEELNKTQPSELFLDDDQHIYLLYEDVIYKYRMK